MAFGSTKPKECEVITNYQATWELLKRGGRLAPPVHKYVHLSHISLKYNGFNVTHTLTAPTNL